MTSLTQELNIIVTITKSHNICLIQVPMVKKMLKPPSLVHAFLNEVNSTKTAWNSDKITIKITIKGLRNLISLFRTQQHGDLYEIII